MKLSNLMQSPHAVELVTIENGQAVTSSLQLADIFDKNHKEVLRGIRDKVLPTVSEFFGQRNFAQSSYINEQGKRQPMYYLTRDGFTMVAMGYTGPKAMEFKEKYIEAFNIMEGKLQKARPNDEDLIEKAATRITTKLFPQFVKTVSATLSKQIVEQIRSLPQGETLLQAPTSSANEYKDADNKLPTQPKENTTERKYELITLYVVISYDNAGNVQIFKTQNYDKYILLLRDLIKEGKPYRVEHIKTRNYL